MLPGLEGPMHERVYCRSCIADMGCLGCKEALEIQAQQKQYRK